MVSGAKPRRYSKPLLTTAVSAVKIPVTVKIRAGFSPDNLNAPEVAYAAQESGAAAVAVHGRTREQYYSGKADYTVIRRVKERVHIPVFGNGDVTDGPSAARLLAETGCDGILVARAARGNPWIFSEILTELRTGHPADKPSPTYVMDMLMKQVKC